MRLKYEEKRLRIQSLMEKKPKNGGRLWEKYGRMIAVGIVDKHPNALHVFEDLDKRGMIRRVRIRMRVSGRGW